MSAGSVATQRVIRTANTFVKTTFDNPIELNTPEQEEAWDQLVQALVILVKLVQFDEVAA